MGPSPIRLGLIGDNIAASRSPALHRIAGRLTGLAVSYDLLRPADLKRSFEDVLSFAEADGYRGLNITYPYKERVITHLDVPDPVVRAIGACNTVLFGGGKPQGWNTDFSGFMGGYRHVFGNRSPGRVAMAGAHIATIPFSVIEQIAKHPLTEQGLEKFAADGDSTDAATATADKDSVKSAFEAYLEKLRNEQAQTGASPFDQGGFGGDGGFAQACRGSQGVSAGSFFSATA